MPAEVTYFIGEDFHKLVHCFFVLVILSILCMVFSSRKGMSEQTRFHYMIFSFLINYVMVNGALFYLNILSENSKTHSIVKYTFGINFGISFLFILLLGIVSVGVCVWNYLRTKPRL